MYNYLATFPESLFPYSNPYYHIKCIEGERIARRSSVVICGLVRQTEKEIPFLIPRIERLGSLFRSYNVVLYENDSKDLTKSLLFTWSKLNPRVKILSETLNKEQNPQDHSLKRRTEMAFYRNKYLEESIKYDTDYTIVLDTDCSWSYEGVLNTLGWYLDACGSNGILYAENEGTPKRLFYDTWAFRNSNNSDEATKNLMRFERGGNPIEVFSCFGGLAIYKSVILEGCSYTQEDCDHVTLHKQIRDKGFRIWLNPSQIVLYSKHYYQF